MKGEFPGAAYDAWKTTPDIEDEDERPERDPDQIRDAKRDADFETEVEFEFEPCWTGEELAAMDEADLREFMPALARALKELGR